MISVVINVRNGMPKVEHTLRSVVSWASEIVVVDMGSTDGTRETCVSAGARVFDVPNAGYADPARAFAVSQASEEWVLIVDADEMIPRALRDRLLEVVRGDEADIVSIAEENWFFGSPLHHSGWQPDTDRHLRFFRRGTLEFSERIHSVPTAAPGARILELPYAPDHAIAHFSYATVSDFVEKMNRYTSIEARGLAVGATPTIRREGIRTAAREVYWRYLRNGGRRSDWRGPVLAALMAMYRLLAVIKAQELRASSRDRVEEAVAREVARLLAEYETPGSS